MKLLMENWRQFVEEGGLRTENGKMYLFEDEKITETSFSGRLNLLTESTTEIESFLREWEESTDYVLSKNVLNEDVMNIVSQAAAVLGKLAGKSWDTVTRVTSKVLDFIQKFKEKHPKIYTALKWACIAIICIAAIYLIAKATGMAAVAHTIESLATFQWPDVAISELVRDLTSQGTVDALRNLQDGLFNRAGDIGMDLMNSDNQILQGLGDRILDSIPAEQSAEAVSDFWGQAMERLQQGAQAGAGQIDVFTPN